MPVPIKGIGYHLSALVERGQPNQGPPEEIDIVDERHSLPLLLPGQEQVLIAPPGLRKVAVQVLVVGVVPLLPGKAVRIHGKEQVHRSLLKNLIDHGICEALCCRAFRASAKLLCQIDHELPAKGLRPVYISDVEEAWDQGGWGGAWPLRKSALSLCGNQRPDLGPIHALPNLKCPAVLGVLPFHSEHKLLQVLIGPIGPALQCGGILRLSHGLSLRLLSNGCFGNGLVEDWWAQGDFGLVRGAKRPSEEEGGEEDAPPRPKEPLVHHPHPSLTRGRAVSQPGVKSGARVSL